MKTGGGRAALNFHTQLFLKYRIDSVRRPQSLSSKTTTKGGSGELRLWEEKKKNTLPAFHGESVGMGKEREQP